MTLPFTRFAPLALCLQMLPTSPSSACDGPRDVREARPAAVKAFVLAAQKSVLTFAGYSGAEYEDKRAMLKQASDVLAKHDPASTLVNIGATSVGIGAVYEIAKQKGYTTIGIVSSLARDEKVELSKCVDHVFFVPDDTWGGLVAGTGRLSPTSTAIVDATTTFVLIGGGDVARDEALGVRAAGKPVAFFPADMSHEIARKKARDKNQPEPSDFKGSAHAALAHKR
jgi:hypothetical protein